MALVGIQRKMRGILMHSYLLPPYHSCTCQGAWLIIFPTTYPLLQNQQEMFSGEDIFMDLEEE